MSDAERIDELEKKLQANHEYAKRLATMLHAHDELLKILFTHLGIPWEDAKPPAPPSSSIN